MLFVKALINAVPCGLMPGVASYCLTLLSTSRSSNCTPVFNAFGKGFIYCCTFGRACALLFLGAHKSNTTENPAIRQLLRFKVGSKYVVLNPALLPRVARTFVHLKVVLFGRFLKDADVEDRKLHVCNLQERYRAHAGQNPVRVGKKTTQAPYFESNNTLGAESTSLPSFLLHAAPSRYSPCT